MIRSMTAYGRVSEETPWGMWTIEVHSVNRKQLDVNIFLPREWLCFDMDVRKWVAGALERGQITVRLQRQKEELLKSYEGRLKNLKDAW